MANHSYSARGVCAKKIDFELDGDTVKNVEFEGGCNGNLKAIAKLVDGRNIDEVIELLEGNTCGPRSTSCADQLAQALREAQG